MSRHGAVEQLVQLVLSPETGAVGRLDADPVAPGSALAALTEVTAVNFSKPLPCTPVS
jgi:hypothetical protein